MRTILFLVLATPHVAAALPVLTTAYCGVAGESLYSSDRSDSTAGSACHLEVDGGFDPLAPSGYAIVNVLADIYVGGEGVSASAAVEGSVSKSAGAILEASATALADILVIAQGSGVGVLSLFAESRNVGTDGAFSTSRVQVSQAGMETIELTDFDSTAGSGGHSVNDLYYFSLGQPLRILVEASFDAMFMDEWDPQSGGAGGGASLLLNAVTQNGDPVRFSLVSVAAPGALRGSVFGFQAPAPVPEPSFGWPAALCAVWVTLRRRRRTARR